MARPSPDEHFAARSAENRRLQHRAAAILNRRASGAAIPIIAASLGLGEDEVRRVIQVARTRGDDRALNEHDALAKRDALAALAPAPPSREEVAALELRDRLRGACVALAAKWAPTNADAEAGLLHLGDLYAYCDRRYPELVIPSDPVLPNRVLPVALFSGCGSPADACAMG